MSDEQTEILRQILDVQKEQLAFAKRQREEFMAVQQTALAGQNKSLRMSRFVIVFMVVVIGAIVAIAFLHSAPKDAENPEQKPAPQKVLSP